jgi:hypothetical protein
MQKVGVRRAEPPGSTCLREPYRKAPVGCKFAPECKWGLGGAGDSGPVGALICPWLEGGSAGHSHEIPNALSMLLGTQSLGKQSPSRLCRDSPKLCCGRWGQGQVDRRWDPGGLPCGDFWPPGISGDVLTFLCPSDGHFQADAMKRLLSKRSRWTIKKGCPAGRQPSD